MADSWIQKAGAWLRRQVADIDAIRKEVLGEDLRRPDEPPLSLAEIARIRNQGLGEAMNALSNAVLGPLGAPLGFLSALSPTFNRKFGWLGLVPSPSSVSKAALLLPAVQSNIPRTLRGILLRIPEQELPDYLIRHGQLLGSGLDRRVVSLPGFVAKIESPRSFQNMEEWLQLTSPELSRAKSGLIDLPRPFAYSTKGNVLFMERIPGQPAELHLPDTYNHVYGSFISGERYKPTLKALKKFKDKTHMADLHGRNILIQKEGSRWMAYPIDFGETAVSRPYLTLKNFRRTYPYIPFSEFPEGAEQYLLEALSGAGTPTYAKQQLAYLFPEVAGRL